MNNILTVEVNLNLKADESLQQIVAYIFGQKLTADNERNPQPATEQPNPEPQPATEAKPKRQRSKKADQQPADPDPQQPDETADSDPQQPDETADSDLKSVSLDEVKQFFFQKLAGHRDEIRSKINELGAPSLSLIDPAKLPEMLDFLKGLD